MDDGEPLISGLEHMLCEAVMAWHRWARLSDDEAKTKQAFRRLLYGNVLDGAPSRPERMRLERELETSTKRGP